ncbi:MAG: TolC family protein, partial [Sulfurihydrogenibium sp.]
SVGLTAEYVPLSKRKAEKQVFSKEKDIVDADREIFERQLIRQIKENYAEFVFSLRKEKILNRQIKLYQDYKKTLEESYKYGKAGLKDLMAVDIKVLELQKQIEETKKARETIKNNIFYLIGGEFPLKEYDDLNSENVEIKDINSSPYIKQINLNIEKIDKEVEKAKTQSFPNFEFSTEYMYRTGFPDMVSFKVGIQISIFKSKKEDLLVLQKKEEKFLKQLDLEDQKLKLKSVVNSSKLVYEKNLKILNLYNQILKEKENQIKAVNLALKYNKAEVSEILKLLDEILQTKLDMLNVELENYKITFQLEEVL